MENRNLLLFKLENIFTEFNDVRQKLNTLKEGDKLILIKDLDKIKVVTDDGIHLGYVPDIFSELISKSMTRDISNSIIDSIDKNIESPSIGIIFDFDNNEIKEKKENEVQEKDEVNTVNEIIQKPAKNNEALIKTIVFVVVLMLFFLAIAKCSDSHKTVSTENLNVDSDSVTQEIPQSNTITPEKKINRDSILKVMHKDFNFKKDEYKSEGFLWVTPKSNTRFRNINRLYMYFSLENGEPQNLRIVLQYTAEDWLFIQSCIFNVDGSVYTYNPTDMQTDNGIVNDESMIWEWCDESLSSVDYPTFEAIGNAKVVKMKLNGRQYYDSRRLTKSEIYYIGKTLEYYKKLGGHLE